MSDDLFGPKPPRQRRVMMKAIDAGDAGALMPGWRTSTGGHFVCPKCGHDDGWSFDMLLSEVKAGLPCPMCNQQRTPHPAFGHPLPQGEREERGAA